MKLNSSVQIISSAMSLPLLLRTLLLTPPSPSQLQAVAALTGSGRHWLQVSMLSPESMDTKNSALCLAKLASASSYQALPSRIKLQLDRRIFASRPPSFVEFLF
ncbi:BnaA02g30790D [Brassica napus]|uniref:Uncharacterized protein n=3 Tax=Brassica TaxID=3705 RepID=M4DVU7_BRACM|nr:unnamed protein product [Brassica napus]CDY33908.1 BnaA02g30790D [Brassica napus]